jgi:hypothetical protein
MPRRNGIDGSGEDAIAYGWFMIVVFILLGAITSIAIVVVENRVIDIANVDITEGTMSQQTYNAIEFNKQMGMYLPVLILLGAFIWSMIRGIGGRGDSSGGATYQAFYTGWVILVLCCMTGFLMAFLGGTLLDRLYTSLDAANMIQGTMVSAAWNQAQEDTMWTFINAYYFLCYLTPCLGAIVYFQAIVRKTTGNRYIQGGY